MEACAPFFTFAKYLTVIPHSKIDFEKGLVFSTAKLRNAVLLLKTPLFILYCLFAVDKFRQEPLPKKNASGSIKEVVSGVFLTAFRCTDIVNALSIIEFAHKTPELVQRAIVDLKTFDKCLRIERSKSRKIQSFVHIFLVCARASIKAGLQLVFIDNWILGYNIGPRLLLAITITAEHLLVVLNMEIGVRLDEINELLKRENNFQPVKGKQLRKLQTAFVTIIDFQQFLSSSVYKLLLFDLMQLFFVVLSAALKLFMKCSKQREEISFSHCLATSEFVVDAITRFILLVCSCGFLKIKVC